MVDEMLVDGHVEGVSCLILFVDGASSIGH